MRHSLYTICVIFTLTIVENSNNECHAQQVLNLTALAEEALSSDAKEAATYFLYAHYLKSPDTFSQFELTAHLLANIKEYAKAEEMLSHIEENNNIEALNDSLRFYYYSSRALVDYYNNDYIAALRSFNNISIEDNKLDEIKAYSYEEIGLYDKAIQVFKSMSNQGDSYSSYRYNCLLGNCYRLMGEFNESIECYLTALRYYPNEAFPYYGIGWAYELSGNDEKALEYYNKGLSVDQSYAYLFLMRGELLLKNGEKEKAEDDFRKVLMKDKVLGDHSCRQYALFFLGRNDDAMTWMNLLIDLQPNDPGNYYDKACLCCRMGLDGEAIKAMKIAFEKGYRKFAHLDADDDIDPIKNNPAYRALYDKYFAIYQNELEQLKDIL